MTKAEDKEHRRLLRLWALGTASMGEIMRCRELDHKAAHEAAQARAPAPERLTP